MTRLRHGSNEDSNVWSGSAPEAREPPIPDSIIPELRRDLAEAHAELATLKRQHEQLITAAENTYRAWCFNAGNIAPLTEVEAMGALRLALDANK